MNLKIEDEVEEVVDDIGDQSVGEAGEGSGSGKGLANNFVVVGRVGSRAVEISGEAGDRVCSVNGTSVGGTKDFCR